MTPEIQEKLTPIFRIVFKDDSIVLRDDLTANDVEKWDSLNHLVMIRDVEEKFGVKFKLKELVSMKNVGDLADLLQKKLS